MELRESGMPDAAVWSTFFSPEETLEALRFGDARRAVVDIGAGYGTFTIAAASLLAAKADEREPAQVHAFDISGEMVSAITQASASKGLHHVRAVRRDVFEHGTGLPDSSVGYAMLFNILHCESPSVLLREAHRVLVRGGLLAVTHWASDRPTPRGPSADIRPAPSQCAQWAKDAGFSLLGGTVELPPHHFGLVFERL